MANHEIDDGLTDEERAALQEEEVGAEAEAATETETETAEEAAPATEEAAEAAALAEPAAEAEPAQEATPTAEAEPEPAAPAAQPILVAQVPQDAEARLAEIATQKEELLTKFDDGEITGREFQKQLDVLAKAEREIEFDVREAKLAEKLENQRLANDWNATCSAFVERNPAYKEMPWLYRELDAKVREIASKPETVNWPGQKFLDEAHKQLKEQYKFPDSTTPAAKPPVQAPAKDRNLPPNLAKVPAADIEDTGGNRFAVLDRMASQDPLAYEEALARMPDAERNAYLSAA